MKLWKTEYRVMVENSSGYVSASKSVGCSYSEVRLSLRKFNSMDNLFLMAQLCHSPQVNFHDLLILIDSEMHIFPLSFHNDTRI
jgi:hypothetical protein